MLLTLSCVNIDWEQCVQLFASAGSCAGYPVPWDEIGRGWQVFWGRGLGRFPAGVVCQGLGEVRELKIA